MASTSETGHVKNVANFENLISFCTGYGPTYNPSRANIQLPALSALHVSARSSITEVNTANTTFINATNARQIAFDPLKKLCTRIVNALEATEATDKLVEDVRTINKKIQGVRSGKPNPEQGKIISVSQQSYDSLAENFAKLIELVGSEATYTPNETELQIAALQTHRNNLNTRNTEVANAYTTYSNARIARNNTLYAPDSGLVDIAFDVKKYVKSVFGTASPQFKQINKLKFKTVKQ